MFNKLYIFAFYATTLKIFKWAQLVVSQTADPGVTSPISVQPLTFMEIDHELFSMVILFLPLTQEGLLLVTRVCLCVCLPRIKSMCMEN